MRLGAGRLHGLHYGRRGPGHGRSHVGGHGGGGRARPGRHARAVLRGSMGSGACVSKFIACMEETPTQYKKCLLRLTHLAQQALQHQGRALQHPHRVLAPAGHLAWCMVWWSRYRGVGSKIEDAPRTHNARRTTARPPLCLLLGYAALRLVQAHSHQHSTPKSSSQRLSLASSRSGRGVFGCHLQTWSHYCVGLLGRWGSLDQPAGASSQRCTAYPSGPGRFKAVQPKSHTAGQAPPF